MFTLSRSVRFAINPAGAHPASGNGYAGVPAMSGLGAHYELSIRCTGEPDPVTGYLINITDIDLAVRGELIPIIERTARDHPATEPMTLLPELLRALAAALAPHRAVPGGLTWHLSPYYSVGMDEQSHDHAVLRQRFEFAASHRLHAPELTDDENRRVYGKCNNPSGHGHNYVIEPTVRVPMNAGAPAMGLPELESAVQRTVIARFDHKHLNTDVDDFAETVASVERIAQRCYELLAPEITAGGAALDAVTVWETEKTSCTYAPGG